MLTTANCCASRVTERESVILMRTKQRLLFLTNLRLARANMALYDALIARDRVRLERVYARDPGADWHTDMLRTMAREVAPEEFDAYRRAHYDYVAIRLGIRTKAVVARLTADDKQTANDDDTD